MRLAIRYQTILLTALLGLVLSSFLIYKKHKVTETFIEIVFESDHTGLIQVFWDSGNGYNPNESALNSIRVIDQKTSVFLKAPDTPFSQIRFDPNNSKGLFKLFEFRFVDGAGNVLGESFPIESFIPHSGVSVIDKGDSSILFEFTNNDPMLLLPVSDNIVKDVLTSDYHWFRDFATVPVIFVLLFILSTVVGGFTIPIVAAWMTWEIFNPGIMSPDSFDQYEQALRGVYHNWHPPILALVLRWMMSLGFGIEHLILGQVLAGYTGLFLLISKCLEFFDRIGDGNFGSVITLVINAIVFLLLISPLTPYSAFLCTYWKDVWVMIALIWIVNLTIQFGLSVGHSKPFSRIILELLAFTFLAVLSIASRYNAVVLIPIYAAIVFFGLGFDKYWKSGLAVLVVVMACFSYKPILNASVEINDLSPSQSVMGLELVGLQILFPDVAKEFPYTTSQIKEGYRGKFRWAGYRYMKWGDDRIMKGDFVRSGKNRALVEEYWLAVKNHFVKMIAVKTMNFVQILDPRTTTEWCNTRISTNRFGVRFNRTFQQWRSTYASVNNEVAQSKWLRLFSAVYLPWFLGALIVLFFATKRCLGSPDNSSILLILGTLIPIGYTFSYLLACVWKAFRYISPSMILIQCFVLTFLIYKTVYFFVGLKNRSKHS